VHDLSQVLHRDVPALPGRSFRQHLTTISHGANRRHPTWSFGPYPPEDPAEPFVVPPALNRHGGRRPTASHRARLLRGATGAWIAPLDLI